MNHPILKNSVLLGIILSLASCLYKPNNSECIKFYNSNKAQFQKLDSIKKYLYADSLCYTYTIQFTAKFLLRETCDSIYKASPEPQYTQLLSDSMRTFFDKFMHNGNIELIIFTIDSISIRFKNYAEIYNNPYIVIYGNERLDKENSNGEWIGEKTLFYPMEE